jgi:aminoglycoside 2''-phosphotransferase
MMTDDDGFDLPAIAFEIVRIAPEFEGKPVARLGEGMDSLAVLVGERSVFRFSKHPEAAMGLRREIAILPRLTPGLALDIPRFEYFGNHSVSGLPFVGYGLIRGEPLHRSLYETLPEALQDGILGELAGFLDAVHAFPVADALRCGVVTEGSRMDYLNDLRRARDDVFPLLRDTVRYEVESRMGEFLEADANLDRGPTLLHGDLWPEHVLFSRAARRLAGVIDFGDVAIGDPDHDLAFLARALGSGFIAGLLRHYPHPDHAGLGEKLRFFAMLNAIHDVFIGLDRGDRLLVDSALVDLTEQARLCQPFFPYDQ